eukprot:m.216413 g.216413  ORF g.216413 m.216413 type:complete len:111 (+) comp46530_c0_seq1:114-446(+)
MPRKAATAMKAVVKPSVVETHAQALAVARSKPAKVLVNKKLLDKYADTLRLAKRAGHKISEAQLTKIDSLRRGKDTHVQVGGNWFSDAVDAIGNVAQKVAPLAPLAMALL